MAPKRKTVCGRARYRPRNIPYLTSLPVRNAGGNQGVVSLITFSYISPSSRDFFLKKRIGKPERKDKRKESVAVGVP